MKIPLFHVDAFTNNPFKGNPAAVCLLNEEMPVAWMHAVAVEMNLSETAFLLPRQNGFQLRWFTPKVEVDLCGHATLASSFVLFEKGFVQSQEPIIYSTRSGDLKASLEDRRIILDFPSFDEKPCQAPLALIKALGVKPVNVIASGENVIIEVDSVNDVYQLEPDFLELVKTPLHGVAVTASSNVEEYDFISRYFAPWAGINEDPVTGSAHACLGPYWGKRLGKQRMTAFQASARGGIVYLELKGERVLLGGQAVMVFEGYLLT